MAFYTIHHRFVECPFWKTEVALEGKYYYSEEPGHEYEAYFSNAQCPIIRNIRLPEHKRDDRYKYYPLCHLHPCAELHNFEPLIDVRTGQPPK